MENGQKPNSNEENGNKREEIQKERDQDPHGGGGRDGLN